VEAALQLAVTAQLHKNNLIERETNEIEGLRRGTCIFVVGHGGIADLRSKVGVEGHTAGAAEESPELTCQDQEFHIGISLVIDDSAKVYPRLLHTFDTSTPEPS
jgi:hypothetical protein